MSTADPTLAERSRRYRERRRTEGSATTTAVLEALAMLTRTVEGLQASVDALRNDAQAERGPSRNDGGQRAGNGPERVEKSPTSVAQRSATNGHGAPAPTGPGGADVSDDAHRVLVALVAKGSAASIRDAIDAATNGPGLGLPRVTAALVHLQARGLVIRYPGQGTQPDQWEATTAAEPIDALAPRLAISPAPHVTVTCDAYQAHRSAHTWDSKAGRFVCRTCEPPGLDRPPVQPAGVIVQA